VNWYKFTRFTASQKRVEDGRTKGNGTGAAEPEQTGVHEGMLPERGQHTPEELLEEREIP